MSPYQKHILQLTGEKRRGNSVVFLPTFRRTSRVLLLLTAALFALPQVLHPFHLAVKHHSEVDHASCCSAACAALLDEADPIVAAVVFPHPSSLLRSHDDCMLCFTLKLVGGGKRVTEQL